MMKLESIFSFFGFADTRRPPPAAVTAPPPAAPIADPIAAKREAIRAKIAGYADLTAEDFEGEEDEHGPTQEDVDNALSFIDHIPDAGIATAKTMVAGDGDVGFTWKNQKQCLEVGFTEGEISFFGDLPNGGERLFGEAKYDKNAIPEKLQRLLSAIFPS